MRTVLTARAERATTDIMFAWSLHRMRRFGRVIRRGRLGRTSSATALEYLILPHVVAIAEDFSRGLLIARSEPLVPQTSRLLGALWQRAERDAESTWDKQANAWQRWHGIRLSPQAKYKRLRAVVEARNAIVHGLGDLTKRQLSKDNGRAVITELGSVGIPVVGRRLLLNDQSMERAVDIACEFVEWLDLEVQKGLGPQP